MTAPASKQLGETQDATELVPGEPAEVRALAAQFGSLHDRADGAFDDFNSALVPGWEGQAATYYEVSHEQERGRWKLFLSLVETSQKALTTYAGALEAAQGKAADALALWNEGEERRVAALESWEQRRQAWNDAVHEGRPADQMPPHPGPGPSDPGAGLRAEAEEILDEARRSLEQAGGAACVAMGREQGSRTSTEGDWWGAEGNLTGPSFNWGQFSEAFGTSPGGNGGRGWEDAAITLGEASGSAWVYRGQGGWEDYWGDARMNADGTFTLAGADGHASGGIDRDGARVNLSGTVTAVGVDGELRGEYGLAEAKVSGEAAVEAAAQGKALVSRNGAHASGELFAGARAGVDGEVDVGGVGGSVGVEGWAGAGIGGDVNVGFESGKFTIGGSGGVAWGVGGKVSGQITLDFPKIYDTGKGIVDGIGDWLDR